MKTNQELLDFYGVKVGKKYKITKDHFKTCIYGRLFKAGEMFQVELTKDNEPGLVFGEYVIPICALSSLEYKEVPEDILTLPEKNYLAAVIRPFRDRVIDIAKLGSLSSNSKKEKISEVEYIAIRLTSIVCNYIETKKDFTETDEEVDLPFFKQGTMYKGMRPHKTYTPEELGL